LVLRFHEQHDFGTALKAVISFFVLREQIKVDLGIPAKNVKDSCWIAGDYLPVLAVMCSKCEYRKTLLAVSYICISTYFISKLVGL